MPGFPGSHRARDICPDSLVKVLALISRMVQELCPDFSVNELVPSSRVGCCREVLVVRERSVNAVAFSTADEPGHRAQVLFFVVSV